MKHPTPEQQARIDLACALRSASRMGLGEGICNHFSVEKGVRALVEKKLSKFAHKLGWRAEFPVETLLIDNRLELLSNSPLKPFGFFTFLEFRRRA